MSYVPGQEICKEGRIRMRQTRIQLLALLGLLSFPLTLPAAGRSLTNDAFLAEIKTWAKNGDFSKAIKQVRSNLVAANPMEQTMGNLYLANLELIDGFDTNRAVTAVKQMQTSARTLPRGKPQVVAAMLVDQAGVLMMYAGLYEEAETCFQWAYDIMARRAGPYHPVTSYVQGRLGGVQFECGKLKDAARNLRDAVTNLQLTHVRLVASGGYTVYRMNATGVIATQGFMSDYANLLRRQEKFRYETNRLKEFLKFVERCHGKGTSASVQLMIRLGYSCESRKSPTPARRYFESAVELAEELRATKAGVYWEALTHAHEYFRREGFTAERETMATRLAEDPGPPSDQTQEAESLRRHLHASVASRLQQLFREEPPLRRMFLLQHLIDP